MTHYAHLLYNSDMSRRTYNLEQEQEIIKEYKKGKTMTELAAIYGGKHHTVSKMLRRSGVPTKGIRHKIITEEMRQDIIASYPKESQVKIARRLGIRQGRVSFIVRMAGLFTKIDNAGNEKANWAGGRINRQGYSFVLMPISHPFRQQMSPNSPYVAEHRLAMAEYLNRPLSINETVHHIDGNRANNNISNLQLRQGKHGAGVVMICGDCNSKNIIYTKL